MSCCTWEVFEESFLHFWHKIFGEESDLLIDWDQAKIDHKKYHMTGMESATKQIIKLRREGEYMFMVKNK